MSSVKEKSSELYEWAQKKVLSGGSVRVNAHFCPLLHFSSVVPGRNNSHFMIKRVLLSGFIVMLTHTYCQCRFHNKQEDSFYFSDPFWPLWKMLNVQFPNICVL